MSKALEIIMVLAIAALAFLIGEGRKEKAMKEEAIKRGDAQYNATTGEFEWKKEPHVEEE